MSTITCTKCNQVISTDDIVKTDEFREYGSEAKNYCSTCFLREVKHGFGNYEIGTCAVCNSPLVLQHDEEETISLAQDDYTIHFTCRKIKDAIDRSDEAEAERLEQEDHDWLIMYTIQPDPEQPDFG